MSDFNVRHSVRVQRYANLAQAIVLNFNELYFNELSSTEGRDTFRSQVCNLKKLYNKLDKVKGRFKQTSQSLDKLNDAVCYSTSSYLASYAIAEYVNRNYEPPKDVMRLVNSLRTAAAEDFKHKQKKLQRVIDAGEFEVFNNLLNYIAWKYQPAPIPKSKRERKMFCDVVRNLVKTNV